MSPARITACVALALLASSCGPADVVHSRSAAQLVDQADWTAGAFPGQGSVAWADWDGDGDVDLAVGSTEGAQPTRVYTSDGGALSTTPAWESDELGEVYDLAWGDLDGDGDLDLAVALRDTLSTQPAGEANRVYENLGGAASGCANPPCWLAGAAAWTSAEEEDTFAVSWVDWDGDGDLDLSFANDGAESRIHDNDGGALAAAGDATAGGWSSGDVSLSTFGMDWGDYDADGDPDLALGNYGGPTQVFNNLGGSFAATATWESTLFEGTWDVAWGDWDGDGDLDLLEANEAGPEGKNRLFELDETTGGFVQAWESPWDGSTRAVAWGDEDLDGDLDLAVANSLATEVDLVLENSLGSDLVVGLWLQQEDLVSFDVAWGDPDGDGDLDLAVGASSDGGALLYTNEGAGLALEWSSDLSHPYEAALISPQAGDWGDFDFDGDLDLVTPQVNSIRAPFAVYLGTGDGSFPAAVLPAGVENAIDAAWGDWDDDGDLDLAVAGQGGTPPRVYENHVIHPTDPGLWFTPEWSFATSLEGFGIGWADWDMDGDLDLALTLWEADGGSGLGAEDLIFENTGGALGAAPAWQSPTQERSWEMDWGDWDCDGDLDLVTAGGNGDDSWIYSNTVGGFAPNPMSLSLSAVHDVEWGDVDGDGDLDLAVARGGANNATRVYENTGDCALPPALTLLWEAAPMSSGDHYDDRDVAWGDWDGDGDLDLAVTTLIASPTDPRQPDRVYENLGGALAGQPAWQTDPSQSNASVWADVDGDGDLDLATMFNDPTHTVDLFANHRITDAGLPDDPTHAVMGNPYGDPASGGAALAMRAVQGRALIPSPDGGLDVPFTLYDDESDPAASVRLEYSVRGGGLWEEATLLAGEVTTDLPALPVALGGQAYSLRWNMADDLATRSDTLALRLVVERQVPRQVSRSVRWGELGSAPVLVRVVPDCDVDGDGYSCLETDPETDCDDDDPDLNPSADDLADDGLDQDCNGVDTITCFFDGDGDGVGDAATTVLETADGDCDNGPTQSSQSGDCDDTDAGVLPGATEACDAVDSDCDGSLVDEFDDMDGDGQPDCADEDTDGDGDDDITDCAPLDPAIHAGAAEACDDVDSDCDGSVADDFADQDGDDLPDCVDLDVDGDGHEGENGDSADCDDSDDSVHPGADESAGDGVDQDCNGVDAVECYEDGDGDGFGSAVTVIEYESGTCDGDGHSDSSDDCDDGAPLVNPDATEACNGVDDDCDGAMPGGEADADGDGFLACDVDCDDGEAARFPGNPEICDGLDNDCDGRLTDDELDWDGDGVIDCLDPDLGPGCTVSCASAESRGTAGTALLLLLPLLLRRRRR